MKEISVLELKRRMDANEDFQLIDVREAAEHDYCNIGGELIPVGEILSNLDLISREKDVVIHCKSGGRSSSIVNALMARGFDNVINLTGGITAWSDLVDPSIPKY